MVCISNHLFIFLLFYSSGGKKTTQPWLRPNIDPFLVYSRKAKCGYRKIYYHFKFVATVFRRPFLPQGNPCRFPLFSPSSHPLGDHGETSHFFFSFHSSLMTLLPMLLRIATTRTSIPSIHQPTSTPWPSAFPPVSPDFVHFWVKSTSSTCAPNFMPSCLLKDVVLVTIHSLLLHQLLPLYLIIPSTESILLFQPY